MQKRGRHFPFIVDTDERIKKSKFPMQDHLTIHS